MHKDHTDIIGIMSGTSLDGLDIALCRFYTDSGKHHNILAAKTISYSDQWKVQLSEAHSLGAVDFMLLHNAFGNYIGQMINAFITDTSSKPDFISSHGHTVMHEPSKHLTVQIGNGAYIAATTGIDTICDFRTLDVAQGGEGAPLVPAGDQLLFNEYDATLNLGGFSNITILNKTPISGFDICPVNILLNTFSRMKGFPYDENGKIAASGQIHHPLLEMLESHPVYQHQKHPSLSREFTDQLIPLILQFGIAPEDILATVTKHIVLRIHSVIKTHNIHSCLVTGGGAYNCFLIDQLKQLSSICWTIPDSMIIEYKEAFIFAFLGLLRIKGHANVLTSVTHGKHNISSGIIWKISRPDEK